jgi:hypothetical protein
MSTTARMIVVFPVPGPPVMTRILRSNDSRMAWRWSGEKTRPWAASVAATAWPRSKSGGRQGNRRAVDGPDDLLLGLVEEGQVEGAPVGQILGHDLAGLDQGGEAVLGLFGADLEVGDALLRDLGLAGEDMALLVVLLQDIKDVSLDPLEGGRVSRARASGQPS